MEENIINQVEQTEAPATSDKTWRYSEKTNKHVTNHTITINKKRFTHIAEIHEAAQSMKQRTDVNLTQVKTVNTYYGLSRNLKATIILALLAVAAFILAITQLGGSSESNYSGSSDSAISPMFIIFILVAAGLGFLAWLVYKRVKPAFILEIETIAPMGQLTTNALAYGSASINFNKKKPNIILIILLVVFWPIGILYLLFRSKGNKYKFEMTPEVGYEIVDTIGPMLIDN